MENKAEKTKLYVLLVKHRLSGNIVDMDIYARRDLAWYAWNIHPASDVYDYKVEVVEVEV